MSATQHGPGGGGGGGVIFSNAALNVASTVTQGLAGISHGSTATDNYGAMDGIRRCTYPNLPVLPAASEYADLSNNRIAGYDTEL